MGESEDSQPQSEELVLNVTVSQTLDENNEDIANVGLDNAPLKQLNEDSTTVQVKNGSTEPRDWQVELEQLATSEEKLQKAIDIMADSLAQSGNPDFKTFWMARNSCLELFKGNIPPSLRAIQWEKYRELTKEARRLKDIFEEHSAFAVEQINIAIEALEREIDESGVNLEKIPVVQFLHVKAILKDNLSRYCQVQRELDLLNTYATRINALRKELIKTEIRIRQKNKLFQRLSIAGDRVFPRRKELIKEISTLFIEDVDAFIADRLPAAKQNKSLYPYREEVKALQGFAKDLTINTHAFSQARLKLSKYWDSLKEEEKERKKTQSQQKQFYQKNAEAVRQKIAEFNESLKQSKLSIDDAQKQLKEISNFMRTLELGRDELRTLREELNAAQKPVRERVKEEEKKRREQILEKEKEKQKKIKDIKDRITTVRDTLSKEESSALKESLKQLQQEVKELGITNYERSNLQRQLTPIHDAIAEKEEDELLILSDGHTEAYKQLEEVLQSRKERRNEIKELIAKYRKACGSSGLDFEQSMYFNEQLNVEKMRLEKINANISLVESKISELKSKRKKKD
ncbi:MAG: hypothetical protein K940chlam7_01950 [Chlamydiae bacterium]|nr:hypothetical protein [Chlamydiota bacterium]